MTSGFSRSFKVEGIIIKRRNFGETDRILTVFTKRNGKIQVKAIGVRKITSRRSPHIELLNHCILTLYKGKSLPILTEVQSLESFPQIKEDLTKVGFAYHICELIEGLCAENQEQIKVFELLLDVLKKLSADRRSTPGVSLAAVLVPTPGVDPIVEVIHGFEIELLTMLGFYKSDIHIKFFNTSSFIESILERKLKSKQILQKLV